MQLRLFFYFFFKGKIQNGGNVKAQVKVEKTKRYLEREETSGTGFVYDN